MINYSSVCLSFCGFELFFIFVLAFHVGAINRNFPANPPVKTIEPIENANDMLPTGSGSFSATSASSPDGILTGNSSSNWGDVTSTTFSTPHHRKHSSHDRISSNWLYILLSVVLLGIVVATFLIIWFCCIQAIWKRNGTGSDIEIIPAIANVKKLSRATLDASCEEFSNVIQCYPQFTVYKGTLSNGVEISVISTAFPLLKDWSKHSQIKFVQKVESLSQINHQNFMNLLGYCMENEPFTRMMVHEFACNGTLSENLQYCTTTSTGLEHLEWRTRMRIIMGIAYCLRYMHHELNPPVAHTNLHSSSILLTVDYAAKIVDMDFWKDIVVPRQSVSVEDEFTYNHNFETPLMSSIEGNIYSFGILLLEIISGKPAYTKERDSILIWVTECFRENEDITYLIDPTLKSFKQNELDVIYKVSQKCINQDPNIRPTMEEATSELNQVLAISPDAATPRLSSLWWSELLALEAT
ncbi:putative Receptor protein kinase [Zostera marina]|uniref:Putative Receptor protein kinase n=1 Tax=Zostera marina TaxID=29655 RepID=A0A0K9PJS6_ZOSMR|nr:putative Receptor protein kinase [Zostera marina]